MISHFLDGLQTSVMSAETDSAGNDPRLVILVMVLLVTIFLGFCMTLLAAGVIRRLVRRRRSNKVLPAEFQKSAWEEAGRRVDADRIGEHEND